MAKSKVLEKMMLSDGKTLMLLKSGIGHRYNVLLCYAGFNTAPIMHNGLLKKQAYEIYTEYLKNDVMDIY